LEHNPIQIPDLTSSILKNLQPLSTEALANFQITTNKDLTEALHNQTTDTQTTTAEALLNLQNTTNEVTNIQTCPTIGLQDVGLNCIYRHSPAWWLAVLLDPTTFPWLPDLDMSLVHKKEKQKPDCGDWNWELLCRQLSQARIYKPDDKTLDLPLALRNRRRIWILLQGARVGDITGE
jgi:hypothetical protein